MEVKTSIVLNIEANIVTNIAPGVHTLLAQSNHFSFHRVLFTKGEEARTVFDCG